MMFFALKYPCRVVPRGMHIHAEVCGGTMYASGSLGGFVFH